MGPIRHIHRLSWLERIALGICGLAVLSALLHDKLGSFNTLITDVLHVVR
jgi:hypothetical protein